MTKRALIVMLGAALGCGSDTPATAIDAPPQPPQIDAVPATCDTVAQDCASHGSAATPKCSLVVIAGKLATRCVSRDGTVPLAGICMRSSGIGHDDCNDGLFCSGLTYEVDASGIPLTRACRAFCRDDSKCGTGEKCVTVGANMPQDGLCIQAGCKLFSTTCATGFTCIPVLLVDTTSYSGLCSWAGPVPIDGDCTSGAFCAANSVCVVNADGMSASCRSHCDDAHACAAPGSCKVLSGLPMNGGYCH